MTAMLDDEVADLRRANAELQRRLDEGLAREAATAEVLQGINSSPGDLAPVFNSILDRAMHLCGATFGILRTYDGVRFHTAAAHGVPPAYAEFLAHNPQEPQPGTIGFRILETKSVVHVNDAMADEAYWTGEPHRRALVDLGGARTSVVVPLMNKADIVGAIQIYRQHVQSFSDEQIALLQSFAAQAVLAMQNARLITETREALEQQTATAEVLGVINSSPGNLAPVFDVMLDKAMRLCEAEFGLLANFDGEAFHAAALHGVPTAFAESWREPRRPSPGLALYRLMQGENLVHVPDVTAEDAYQSGNPIRRALGDLGGARTGLWVALRTDAALLGAFVIYRKEVRPFTDKQIALLQNFAAQAVIAMENARLITETREALEQQTATAEVLGVINSSPGDLAPVFDAILEKAHSLCGAELGVLLTYDGESFWPVAAHGASARFSESTREGFRPSPGNPFGRVLEGEPYVHIADVGQLALQHPDDPGLRIAVEIGLRTFLIIPLRKDDVLLGAMTANRREVRPFTDKQIALLQNFAAQAVIAMENARLLTETREALEQQTATAEVLQVINFSPGDLAPVFDAMLEKALHLCEATFGDLCGFDGQRFLTLAVRGVLGAAPDPLDQAIAPDPGSALERIANGDLVVHFADLVDTEAYRAGVASRRYIVEAYGARTALWVALRKDDAILGVFIIYRQEVRPFSDKQIALLQNFAAQAVIAMENARLITETREALEQQTATAEVLQVINSSPGDLTPVFDAMLEKATRLCDAPSGIFWTFDGEYSRATAMSGIPESFAEYLRNPVRLDPETGLGRVRQGERVAVSLDLAAEEAYRAGNPQRRAFVDLGRARSAVRVPLIKDSKLLGIFTVYRQEVRPFTDNQIAFLENFAAQAVIAMENARLINETREALEQQTATAEVLQVINSSPGDLEPVFEAMLEKATRLCEAPFGILRTWDGERLHFGAVHGDSQFSDWVRQRGPIRPDSDGSPLGRILAGERVVSFADAPSDEGYRTSVGWREMVEASGVRSAIWVALHKDDALLGYITVYRQQVRPFSDKQVALLQNFAAQAVIAMENARLITETRETLEQQTATAEVLQVINRSPGNLAPVFDAMLEKAMHLCSAAFGIMTTYDGETFLTAAHRGLPPRFAEYADTLRQGSVGWGGAHIRMVKGADIVHLLDAKNDEAYPSLPSRRALVDLGGARTVLAVAMRRDDALLGSFAIYRQEVQAFSDKEISILQSFAAQAVIAIENARLLSEIRQRQAELRVTFDNMADGVAMFDEDLRLTAWNRNFQQILDLPDAVLAERPSYADYLRILAERGEFGTEDVEAELSRRLDHTDQELRLERTRPDGRVIEVRRNAVAGGGFVLIYSDVTERKRSEAEIRAARDAAEAAYRDLKTAQAGLIQAEKMASLGQLTAGIAHEIKNPLNFVNNFAGLSVELLDELKETAAPAISTLDDERRTEIDETIEMLTGNLEKIAEHGRRADNIVKSMLEHSRGSSGERRSVDLNGLIEEALNLAYHGARAQDQSFNITLERDYAAGMALIELAPQDITRLFLNLFSNGFYAATKRQKVGNDLKFQPTLKVSTRDLGDAVEICVRDNGIGIPAEIKDKLFQPFFTTKPTGEGTGLGLPISYDIVTQQHSGTIEVDSGVGEFTEFTVRLPRTHRATMAEAAS